MTLPSAGDFPRGGKRSFKQETAEPDENDLFQAYDYEEHPTAKKAKFTKGKKDKRHIRTSANNLEPLSFQDLTEGLLLLGFVKEVQDYHVKISLPYGLVGHVPATAVSQAYTKQLQAVAEAADDDVNMDVASLKDLFSVGDPLPCRVLAAKVHGHMRQVDLSIDPKEVNKGMPITSLKAGSLLFGTVASAEDHGFMIDLGIPGIQAFLQTDEQEHELHIGKPIWCTLQTESGLELASGDSRVVRVSADSEEVQQAQVAPQMVTTVECLRPGMKATVTVEKILDNGLRVKCLQYGGTIHRSHLPGALRQYTPGQKVEARVLCIHPVSKSVTLSLLPGVVDSVGKDGWHFADLSVGDIVDDAEVLFVDKGHGVYFRIQQFTALAHMKHLSDKEVKDVHKVFPRGSKHSCRIIGFHPADDVVLVSLKESIMQEKYLSIKDIKAGEITECKVRQFHASGLIVRVGKDIFGLVPIMHTADVPIKKLEKKFEIGEKLKCRVLKVDVKKGNCILSNKKSLVKSSLLFPASYDELSHGMQLEGYVKAIKPTGVVVGFCNDVAGWVRKSELSTVDIADPAAVFYPGQVVRCRVLFCDPATQQLKLSLIISGKSPFSGRQKLMEDFEAGKLMKATVVKKVRENVEVKLQPEGHIALLPKHHLADSADNQELLWRCLEPGQTIDSVMLFKQTSHIVVTKKEMFLSAARDGVIPKSFSDIEPGQLLPGVVKNHQSYGIFVELPGGLSGLVPHKFTMDRPITDLTGVFASGQSVAVKITEVKQENNRFLCSLRMCDCFHDDPKVGMEMLETFLEEREPCMTSSNLLDERTRGLQVGNIILVEVTKASKQGYVCQTDWGMAAIVTDDHTGEVPLTVGSKVEAVVLHIDPLTPCLELSTDRSLVQAVSRRIEKPHMDKAREGQRIKAAVVLVKEDFILVSLRLHARGTFAYVPTKQHPNDVLAKNAVDVGEETHVIIQKSESSVVLANFESRIPKVMAKKGKFLAERHELRPGQVVKAMVTAIHQCQMNISIGKVRGRVHVTEMADHLEDGTYAFAGYHKGQEVKVKVIGFRHIKTQKYLPLTHSEFHMAMPECTMKPSKMKEKNIAHKDLAKFDNHYQEGDKVLVFPFKHDPNKVWACVSPTMQGYISVFDLSRDLGKLQHPEKHFLIGHGYLATVLAMEENTLLRLSLSGHKEQVQKKKMVTGKVTSITDHGIFLRLPDGFRGCIRPTQHEDESSSLAEVAVGRFVRCRVMSCKDKEKCVLTTGEEAGPEDEPEPITHKPCKAKKADKAGKEAKKLAKRKRKRSMTSISEAEELELPTHTQKKQPSSQLTEEVNASKNRLQVPDEFLWEEQQQTSRDKKESESEDEEEEEEGPKKKKRKTVKSETETAVAEGQTQKDYDKLLLARPNDSLLWIEYMSEHLNAGDIDRARSVAEQAIKTILFREEQERLNVWIALLNLENLYGSKEDVTKVFQRALQNNDPLMLYRRVAAMYNSSGKVEEAESTYQTMVRRFKQNKQVWIDFGLFLYKLGRLDAARNLLQRSLLSLEKWDHVDTIAKFAQMEFSHGDQERGVTMFEKIMAEFPRRSDIMSVYIDMVIKTGDFDKARELFERAATATKNPKFFFKKYLAFEEKYGTDDSVARVKDKIESYA